MKKPFGDEKRVEKTGHARKGGKRIEAFPE